jgi:hypothetical protein
VNAAQLLLGRIETTQTLEPRHVVLPTRLIIRHSCGSHLHDGSSSELSLPVTGVAPSRIVLVKPVHEHAISEAHIQ